jgi:ABC-type uncharacterized transport system permease subunit
MILSIGPAAGPLWQALALVAAVAYAAAALAPEGAPGGHRVAAMTLVVGWLVHALVWGAAIAGLDEPGQGPRFGFAPVLSVTVWLVLGVHAVESRFFPLPGVRRVLAALGVAVVLLALAFPGDRHPVPSPWLPLHWLLGVASYGLFGAAVLHGWLLDRAEGQLRGRQLPPLAAGGPAGPLGLPLLRLEKLTFRFVEAGFVVLTAALLLGAGASANWRWDHKTVFSLLGWAVFAALIAGRRWQDWHGRRATRWLYVGAGLLALAYLGSRFVLEVLLQRGTVAA